MPKKNNPNANLPWSVDDQNVTRQTIRNQDLANPDERMNAGYEGEPVPENEFYIPACGIADADAALKKLFANDIGFHVKSHSTDAVTPDQGIPSIMRPTIIFATGERWALAKKLLPPRDKNRTLILPAISIRRTGLTQTDDDISGRGINQTTGTLTVKRRLSKEFDRDYQNINNTLSLSNLNGSVVPVRRNTTVNPSDDQRVHEGGLLDQQVATGGNNNVWEIFQIPQPQFYTSTYEVVFWTQYTLQMNTLIEQFVSSYLPQSRAFKLQTDKGYWFMAYVEDNYQSNDNFDDFKDGERVSRYTITMKIKGYILPGNAATDRVPIHRWISSPSIRFDVSNSSDFKEIQTAKSLQKSLSPQEQTMDDGSTPSSPFNLTDLNSVSSDGSMAQNPTETAKIRAIKRGNRDNRYVTLIDQNQKKGESVYKAKSPEALEQFLLGK